MTQPEKLFKGQLENEEVVSYFRRHWVVMLPDILSFGFFLIVFVTISYNIMRFGFPVIDPVFFQMLVGLAVAVIGFSIHRFFVRLLAHGMDFVIITNMRIVEIRKSLFLHNDQESFYMWNIQDVHQQQNSFFKNVLGFGELVITLEGGSDSITIQMVPTPDRYFRLLNRIRTEWTGENQLTEAVKAERKQRPVKPVPEQQVANKKADEWTSPDIPAKN